MFVQASRQDVVVHKFQDHPAVMLVIVLEAGEEHHGWPHVYVVGEEIARLSHTQILHARTHDADERARDLRLNVAVIPCETGADGSSGTRICRGGLEEEIRIAE